MTIQCEHGYALDEHCPRCPGLGPPPKDRREGELEAECDRLRAQHEQDEERLQDLGRCVAELAGENERLRTAGGVTALLLEAERDRDDAIAERNAARAMRLVAENERDKARELATSLDVCGAALRTLLNVLQLSNEDLRTLYGSDVTLEQAAVEARAAVEAWEARR